MPDAVIDQRPAYDIRFSYKGRIFRSTVVVAPLKSGDPVDAKKVAINRRISGIIRDLSPARHLTTQDVAIAISAIRSSGTLVVKRAGWALPPTRRQRHQPELTLNT